MAKKFLYIETDGEVKAGSLVLADGTLTASPVINIESGLPETVFDDTTLDIVLDEVPLSEA